MSENEKQFIFSNMVGQLIDFAYKNGYTIQIGDAYAKTGHKENSFHYRHLAIDLNLFKNGVYLERSTDHRFLGDFWKSIGGSWGGDFSEPDGNHYSYGE